MHGTGIIYWMWTIHVFENLHLKIVPTLMLWIMENILKLYEETVFQYPWNSCPSAWRSAFPFWFLLLESGLLNPLARHIQSHFQDEIYPFCSLPAPLLSLALGVGAMPKVQKLPLGSFLFPDSGKAENIRFLLWESRCVHNYVIFQLLQVYYKMWFPPPFVLQRLLV